MTRILLAAPHSGAGKTTVTLGILRALARRGIAVQPAKSGPDYIDPGFHTVAAGRPSFNLDAWAMSPARLQNLAAGHSHLVVEGAMGLFDGAGLQGDGSAAQLADHLDCSYVLVVDCAKMAHSVKAIVYGVLATAQHLRCAGLILNRVGSDKHLAMLRAALADSAVPILGHIPRDEKLTLPERHLGLVLAGEISNLDSWLEYVANAIDEHVDLTPFLTASEAKGYSGPPSSPPGQRIAVAQDAAFAFAYPHMLSDWRKAGAEIAFFSPLADDAVPDCDFAFLPGGYPELHAGVLATASRFLSTLKTHAKTGRVYGECGGYMTLGQGLVDASGVRHQMAGMLNLETSFEMRKLHLGYRDLTPLGDHFSAPLKAHEFHYATTTKAQGSPLFAATDADGNKMPDMGLQQGNVSGSFTHVIDWV